MGNDIYNLNKSQMLRKITKYVLLCILLALVIGFVFNFFSIFSVFEISKLKKLAAAGDGEACLCLAVYYEDNKNDNKSNEYLRKGAYYGNPHAQYLSASMLLGKSSIEQMQDGFILLNKSAEKNFADAQNSLGDILSPHKCNKLYIDAINALGIKDDQKKSEYWYRKSAKNGHLMAMQNLAWSLTKQHDNKNDRLLDAYRWSLVAISRSDPKSVLSDDLRQLQFEILKIASGSGYELEEFKETATKLANIEQASVPIHRITGLFDDTLILKCKAKVK